MIGLFLGVLIAGTLILILLAVARPRAGLPLLLLALGLIVWSFWIEPRRLVVTRLTLPVEGLASPVRAVAIGDVQPMRLHWPVGRIAEMIDRARAEEPDIVLWLGDYAYTGGLIAALGLPSFVEPAGTVAQMARLDAPMGAFAVLGNHDWWWDGDEVIRLLRAAGIRVLIDETVVARHPASGAALRIAGLDDVATPRESAPERVLAEPSPHPTLVLAHSPDIFPRLPDGFALALAGHTHCGQVLIPGLGRPVVPIREKRFACGLVEEGGRRHFITSGIGTSIIPVRFLTPPEIVVIDLVPR